jgi:hypothetical protein
MIRVWNLRKNLSLVQMGVQYQLQERITGFRYLQILINSKKEGKLGISVEVLWEVMVLWEVLDR